MSTITITVTGVGHDIKWGGDGGLHEKITNILTADDDNAYKIGTGDDDLTRDEVDNLKKEIRPAAVAYKTATAKKTALDVAIDSAKKTALINNGGLPETEYQNLINAIKAYNTTTTGGGSKRRGSKRGSKKRRGSKSKRRKY
jgi:hypothetical protein